MKPLKTWLRITVLSALVACGSDPKAADSAEEGDLDSAAARGPAATITPSAADEGSDDGASAKGDSAKASAPVTASRPASSGPAASSASAPSPEGAAPASPASGSGSAPSGGDSAGSVPRPSDTPSVTPMTGAAAGSGAVPPAKDEPVPPPPTDPSVQSGTLTAGAWDDNLNFDRFKKYRAGLVKQQLHGVLGSTDEEHASAHEEFGGERAARKTLDVALVIDTTGSMGDEIRYLQVEFLALSQSIGEQYPDAEQRWALIAYRDQGDSYVTRVFDFEQDAESFRTKLSGLSAGGGGDFPEAPDAALAAMAQLNWREDDTTARLAFWVADAPHHDGQASAMLEAIRSARTTGVHVYPVASSGIDELTELTMRSASQLTGGRYVFLTDDSGVGGAHKEPTIPCYYVTRLDSAILRMVDAELTGKRTEPSKEQIIRTTGAPENGTCQLTSNETVVAF